MDMIAYMLGKKAGGGESGGVPVCELPGTELTAIFSVNNQVIEPGTFVPTGSVVKITADENVTGHITVYELATGNVLLNNVYLDDSQTLSVNAESGYVIGTLFM